MNDAMDLVVRARGETALSEDMERLPTTGEDDAHRCLGVAMVEVLHALQSTQDESVMNQLGQLLTQMRRVQYRLE